MTRVDTYRVPGLMMDISETPDPKPVTRKPWPVCFIVPTPATDGNECSLGI